ncbi:MAG: DUF1501 domain-containing protein [Dermatophilaceae bacterium]
MNTTLQHPDCPDWRRLGPTPEDAALRAVGDAVQDAEAARRDSWSHGFTRRRLLAGGLGVGVAALADQHVTTRTSFAATGTGTLVVVFLRGGLDGLSVLVPASGVDTRHLDQQRPTTGGGIGIPTGALIPWTGGFGLHPALAPLRPMVNAGKVAAVPAIATPDLSRSHFQAQDCLERGGASGSPSQTGWLDRVLEQSGPGTTWRGVGAGHATPRSMLGPSNPLTVSRLKHYDISVDDSIKDRTRAALGALYTGLDHSLSRQTRLALDASTTALSLAGTEAEPDTRGYGTGNFGAHLATLSTLIRAGVGLRVATVDLGGWDMHTGLGTVDAGDMRTSLGALAAGLRKFFDELGAHAESTTVVLMSEFGRRVSQNANAGTDHGHGGLGLVLGGGVAGGVHGRWPGLAPEALDHGDLAGANDYRNFLGEIVMRRLGLSAGQVRAVFPGWTVAPYGVMRAT